jgi:excisionase family DNA binding protein
MAVHTQRRTVYTGVMVVALTTEKAPPTTLQFVHTDGNAMIRLLHAEELARLAGVHKSTILLAIRRGELKASRTVGRSARITPEDAKEFLRTRNKPVPSDIDVYVGTNNLAVLTENPELLGVVQHAMPAGMELISSGSPYVTLIAVGARVPSLLVVDLDMVFMNPVALIRALRNSSILRSARIVAVGMRDDLFGAARAAGANHVLVKIDTTALAEVFHSTNVTPS